VLPATYEFQEEQLEESTPSARALDGALERAVGDRLRHAAYLELRRIKGMVCHRVLTLTGYVTSYYLRQVAQTAVQELEGIEAIDNRIEVIPGGSRWERFAANG
jgi:osmotically-inducible protein OsmY